MFPSFSLANQDGQVLTRESYKGKWLVVYVYPKDDTPGCTVQGKAFTSTKAKFDALNVAVLGLSADDVASHKSFCNKFGFTHTLLADPQATLLNALGVGQSEWKGTKYWDRTTFVIDPSGKIQKVYEKVNPEGHDEVLMSDIAALQKL
jgi:thioredoxin-dependent peroxiredoxin